MKWNYKGEVFMSFRILYEPFKTLEEQDLAEHKLKMDTEMLLALEQEQ